MGTLFSLSKSATSIALDISEIALLLFGILLVVGLIGEYAKSERWKRYARTFEMFVIIGVAGELFADGGIFLFSSHLQTIADIEIGELTKEAGDAKTSANEAADAAQRAKDESTNALALASGARRELDSFASRLAEARQLAAHAEQGTAALTAANAGRRLTSEQKNKLATILTRFAPTAITLEWTSAGGQESVDLAKDINDAIVGAGIPMTTANRAILMDQYFKGVLLRVGDDRKSEASAIAGFLIEANLATKPVHTLPAANAQVLAIVIGSKP